ncbi:polysaccharide pyruvyl transferase family protein [Bradyrhizobium murdochi]|uniref:polysaccharide pyruvyl transferase family protein n=1 Tax=Bradyrhizobium murdochi TaxID=1038859 RepID=UPI000419729F|nr:polysaccharide pyruvyl transferase family protein [Bradyrhizobium murdochi]
MSQKVLIVGYNGLNNAGADLRSVIVAQMLQTRKANDFSHMTLCTFDMSRSAYLLPGARQVLLGETFLPALTSAVSTSDLVAISEGCAFFPKPFALYAQALRLAADMNKRAVVFGCSVGALLREHYAVLSEASTEALIFTRDELSYRRLQARGIVARLGTDPVWALDLSAPDVKGTVDHGVRASANRDLIVVCPGYRFANAAAYEVALAKALRPFAREKVLVLVSFASIDDDVCERVARRLAAQYMPRSAGFKELFAVLTRAHAVVSARYHGIVLGILSGAVPILVAQDKRLLELGKMLPWPNLVIDWREMYQSDRLQQAIAHGMDHPAGVSISNAAVTFRASALAMQDKARRYMLDDEGKGERRFQPRTPRT